MKFKDHSSDHVLGLQRAGRAVLKSASAVLLLSALACGSAWAQGADVVFQVQQLQEEVRELRGLVEQQAAEIDRLKQQQRDQYLDLDDRISDLTDGSAPVPEQAADPVEDDRNGMSEADMADESGQAPDSGIADADVEPPEVDSDPSGPASISGVDQPDSQMDEVAPAIGNEDDKARYDAAFQHLRDLRYAQAADAFSDFLDDYPDSEYADNAQYWLGESYYVTGNYDLALDAFDRLLDDFPNSPKTADALLKIGYTQYELENWSQARTALEAVKNRYPDTTLARLADNRLRAMRLEGHY